MKLQAGFLADRTMLFPNGTFQVWQGGLNKFLLPSFPGRIQFIIVLRLEFDAEEAGRLHRLAMRILHEDDEVGPLQTFPFPGPDHAAERFHMNLHMSVAPPIRQAGEGRVEVSVDERLLPHIYFTVQQGPAGPHR